MAMTARSGMIAPELQHRPMSKEQRVIISHNTVKFDDDGATITSSIPRARYRINAATATNAIDFMKHHRVLCFAMMNAHPEELVAYRIQETAP